MPKASTSAGSLQKISNALETLKKDLSYKEYRKWNCREFPRQFAISTTFSTVLRNLKAIEVNPQQRGEYRLTERMVTLRPSTVVKGIRNYQAECADYRGVKRRPNRRRINLTQSVQTSDTSFETIIIALKEQIRKEVMSELLSSLTKA